MSLETCSGTSRTKIVRKVFGLRKAASGFAAVKSVLVQHDTAHDFMNFLFHYGTPYVRFARKKQGLLFFAHVFWRIGIIGAYAVVISPATLAAGAYSAIENICKKADLPETGKSALLQFVNF